MATVPTSLLSGTYTDRALSADLCGEQNTMFYRTIYYDNKNPRLSVHLSTASGQKTRADLRNGLGNLAKVHLLPLW